MHTKKDIKILAIETSCDETAAAVIGEKGSKPVVLSNIVSSQADLHSKTNGVVPEVASRAHMEAIIPVISQALIDAKQSISNQIPDSKSKNEQENDKSEIENGKYSDVIFILQNEITHVAVTSGPGLIGSLLVGYNAAKTMSYALNLPNIPVNHIEGHIYSAFIGEKEIAFPVLALTVSGGHTSLTLMRDHGKYDNLGETLDDAAGEAFDKVAKLLDLGYPGGPVVSKYAALFRELGEKNEIIFPRPILNDGGLNFSFSGLKTAVLQTVLNIKKERELTEDDKQKICAAFEDAVVDVLITKTIRAIEKNKPKTVVLAGGVAANKTLRETLSQKIKDEYNIDFKVPEFKYCGDNAAMIGLAAYYHVKRGDISSWDKIKIDSNLELR